MLILVILTLCSEWKFLNYFTFWGNKIFKKDILGTSLNSSMSKYFLMKIVLLTSLIRVSSLEWQVRLCSWCRWQCRMTANQLVAIPGRYPSGLSIFGGLSSRIACNGGLSSRIACSRTDRLQLQWLGWPGHALGHIVCSSAFCHIC